jgi:hypothetical protein
MLKRTDRTELGATSISTIAAKHAHHIQVKGGKVGGQKASDQAKLGRLVSFIESLPPLLLQLPPLLILLLLHWCCLLLLL